MESVGQTHKSGN